MSTGEEPAIYQQAMRSLREQGVAFAIGGGFAKMYYTGQARFTKDLDIYVRPTDREAAIRAISRTGMADYYDQQPYDREWIHRFYRNEVIVDVI